MYEHNGFGLMFDKGQKQSSTLSCDSSYFCFVLKGICLCMNLICYSVHV